MSGDENERSELERRITHMRRLYHEANELHEPMNTAVEKILEEIHNARGQHGTIWNLERWAFNGEIIEITYRYGSESNDTQDDQITHKLFLDYFTDRAAYVEEIDRVRSERLAADAKSREDAAARTIADKRRDLDRLKKELGET